MHADSAVKHIIRVMSVVAALLGLLVAHALGVDSFDIYLILFVAIGGVSG